MVPVIIGLLLTGCVLILASFIFSSSFSDKSDKRILTEEEIEKLVERRFHEVKYKLDDEAEKSADQIKDQTERELEKLSNEKIMAVNEYSDQVMDQINKNHNEVMFLYSMLSDKQKELDHAVEKLNRVKQQAENEERLADRRRMEQEAEQKAKPQKRPDIDAGEDRRAVKAPQPSVSDKVPAPAADMSEEEKYRNKERILLLYAQGLTSLEIAQKLHLGTGEVQLVLDLNKER